MKTYGVYKRVVGIGTERIAEAVEADTDRNAIIEVVDVPLGGAGALTYNGAIWRGYNAGNGVWYFAVEVG